MAVAAGGREVEIADALADLLDRAEGGPGEDFVYDLAHDAALDRPVAVDAATAAAAVAPYTWLLDRVGADGIALTSAGHLPPAVVTETMSALGWDASWRGKSNRERHTLPVLELREAARAAGLLRKSRGVLVRTALGTRLGDDPLALWWHLAGRLPAGRLDVERDAGVLLLLAVAGGRALGWEAENEVVRVGLLAAGWTDTPDTPHLTEWSAAEAARPTAVMLRQVGVPGHDTYLAPAVPPSAASVAFARAALRGSTP